MSRVIKCDRCGKVYIKNSNHWVYDKVDDIVHGVRLLGTGIAREPECDLCDSCIEDFRAFMDHYDDKEEDKNGEERTERDRQIGFVGCSGDN